MYAIEVTEFGDDGVLERVERDRPEPGPGEVLVEVEAAGVNFADVMQRRGHYHGGPEPPYVPGMEAAGTIAATGEGVDREVGERVVAMTGGNAYAEYVTAPALALFDVPESMSFAEAAGFPVQFLTAHHCLHDWGGLEPDESVLIHAAAGGVGTAAVQLASLHGAEVFGTASTAEKRELAERLGCDHPIDYTTEDFVEVTDDLTDGDGLDLVLDGVGGDVFADSVDALSHFGRVVAYGAASGEPGTVDTATLLFGNKSVEGFHLGRAMERDPERIYEAVPELSELLATGELEVVVGQTYDLADAADAHRALENRETTGKVVLEP
ncbi:quinone oxidoreductase family protein [Halobacterium litoreum]|uniref:Zinc-binding alcohol dehydrogenase family protein n=1 Tax=Halobacterium litoreum TaxID=2039234 RepID=A0ABD5NBI0_9EURY|nr:NADPH:quinone oxidoreductase family protein [Halobacterium litoreum]UHH14581.1 NADPH:quinone oxidoreductase family protein [Halobacterium litoreum]